MCVIIAALSGKRDGHRQTPFADRSWFQNTLANKSFSAGEYQIGRVTQQPTINFGYPVLSEAGDVKYVVFAAVGLKTIDHIFSFTHVPPSSTLTFVDRSGTILSHFPDNERLTGTKLTQTDISDLLESHFKGTRTLEIDDLGRQIVSFQPVYYGTEQIGTFLFGVPEDYFKPKQPLLTWGLIAASITLTIMFVYMLRRL